MTHREDSWLPDLLWEVLRLYLEFLSKSL